MPFSKYSSKQKKLARIAEPRDAITGADFAALKKKPKKMAGGGKLSSKKRYGNAIKRKLANIQERTSGDMFDEQEFKVQEIPTPKI
jgi:hypothetical protein